MRVIALAFAFLLAACSTALPPSAKVTDVRRLAGTYSGSLQEDKELDRSARLVVDPDGKFELAASDPKGFRTGGRILVGPNDTLTSEYDEMRGRGLVAKGRVAVYEGDGQRVIVMTKDDGTMTTRVSKSLP
jgi:hypothetical protein